MDTFNSRKQLTVDDKIYTIYQLTALADQEKVKHLPYSLKILLENLLRLEDGVNVRADDIKALINWSPKSVPEDEIAFMPARVILQDFTGVPAIVDLAAMRDAMKVLGGPVERINPLNPVELVIDHSVMVDYSGTTDALTKNADLEFERNQERYAFLRWGQEAFKNFRVVPPDTGIVHQVNLEYLARVVFTQAETNPPTLYPDSLVGTDSHTTMINGLGVLGWGVGGIEAEAAMLGQPIPMLIPEVIGFKFTNRLREGATATDLVLTVTQMLRKKNVVGKFVEFHGDGLDYLPLADRATIANMAPEYGATCGIFPIDEECLNFLRLTGREDSQIRIVEAYAKAQGLFRVSGQHHAHYTDVLELDLSTVEPSIAGPKRPQDRIALTASKTNFETLRAALAEPMRSIKTTLGQAEVQLTHGSVVIAALTSCTNTSNPNVMIAAGLVAKRAYELGITTKPWVKTSLAPGSQVVTDYFAKSGLNTYLDKQGFNLVGYGCTTCIGNSGPLDTAISQSIKEGDLSVAGVLSGNRNFEGRVHPEVKLAYLASPPLVVAYALAGTMDIDFYSDPIAKNSEGRAIYLKDIWPSHDEIQSVVKAVVKAEMFTKRYSHVFEGEKNWQSLNTPQGELYQWDEKSSYVKHPPYFEQMQKQPQALKPITGARVLALLGDSVTTDHISPAGNIGKKTPAARYLESLGIAPADFNSYGSRRGNHEVMVRGTFANIRLKNLLCPGTEGGVTRYHPTDEVMSIYEASEKYRASATPLVVLAGKEYGTGSSRDWAAKGTLLLGVRIVIAESFERIHRSNLVGMGILPLVYTQGENAQSLGLKGNELFSVDLSHLSPRSPITVSVTLGDTTRQFQAMSRIDTPKELEYFEHGGILPYVLRQLAGGKAG